MKKSLGARTLVYPLPVWVVGTYDKEKGIVDIEKLKPVIFTADSGSY